MSNLLSFDLGYYIEEFELKYFIETGLGEDGSSLVYASFHPFSKLFSVDLNNGYVEKMMVYFKNDKRVKIFHDKSVNFLEKILPEIDGNIFFFLDAHFPNANHQLSKYDDEKDLDIRLPLEQELDLIYKYRLNKFMDIIVCDDLRIYEEGDFGSKNLKDIGLGHLAKYGTDFLNKFAPSHHVNKFYNREGQILLVPKKI